MATPSDAMVERLRRMIAEPVTSDTYTESMLRSVLERYPLLDSAGHDPSNTSWVGGWDFNRAAADLWEEKAAVYIADFDFSADGGDYKRSQAYTQMLAAARRFRSLRSTSALVLVATPAPSLGQAENA